MQRSAVRLFSPPEGATEVELNDIEAQIGCRLPDDYRCSYRIHNGQKLVIPGWVSVWGVCLSVCPPACLTSTCLSVCLCSGWWAACPCRTTTAPRSCWTWRRRPEVSSRGRGWGAACRSPSASTQDSASTWLWSRPRGAGCSRASTPAPYVPFQNKCALREGESWQHVPGARVHSSLCGFRRGLTFSCLCLSGSDGSGSFGHRHVHHRSDVHSNTTSLLSMNVQKST